MSSGNELEIAFNIMKPFIQEKKMTEYEAYLMGYVQAKFNFPLEKVRKNVKLNAIFNLAVH
jgi:hypothetical protein